MMAGKVGRENKKGKYATQEEILRNLLVGGAILLAATTPVGGAAILRVGLHLFVEKIWQKYDQRRLKQSVKRMVDRELLEIVEEDGLTKVVVTEKGKKKVLKYDLEKMTIPRPKRWDGKWRVVVFDVGEEKKRSRDILREKMKSLGFFALQKSVYVIPYPCKKEIAFLRQVYEIGEEVSVFTAVKLEEEDFLKNEFKIKWGLFT